MKADRVPFTGCFHIQRSLPLRHQLPGVLEHRRDFGVIMVRVVMEHEQALDSRL